MGTLSNHTIIWICVFVFPFIKSFASFTWIVPKLPSSVHISTYMRESKGGNPIGKVLVVWGQDLVEIGRGSVTLTLQGLYYMD